MASAPAPSNKLTTAAILVPMFLFGFDKLQQFGSSFTFSKLSSPFTQTPVDNTTLAVNATFGVANKFEIMKAQYTESCPTQKYQTKLFSMDPLILYVEDYTTKDEAEYLLDLAEPYYQQSPLSGPEGRSYNNEVRKSVSAVVPDDPVVRCISRRSGNFQGLLPVENVEDVQLVKYGTSDHFRPHFDWHPGMLNPRISTFFVYLACDSPDGTACEGGGTGFPYVDGDYAIEWCEKFIDCEESSKFGGVVFQPIVGNAVFWRNFYQNDTGVPGVYHAGMPVRKGRKVGLNIFSRKEKYLGDVLAISDPSKLSEKDRIRCAGQEVCYVAIE